jgi:ribosomal protein L28
MYWLKNLEIKLYPASEKGNEYKVRVSAQFIRTSIRLEAKRLELSFIYVVL